MDHLIKILENHFEEPKMLKIKDEIKILEINKSVSLGTIGSIRYVTAISPSYLTLLCTFLIIDCS